MEFCHYPSDRVVITQPTHLYHHRTYDVFVKSALCYILGLSCRELLRNFQHQLVILFKLMMLERRVS